MPPLTRRGVIVLAGGASALALAAGAGLATVPPAELARATLRRLAGPFVMADAEFDAFFRDFMAAAGAPGGLKAGVLRVAETVPGGARWLAAAAGSADSFEAFERALLTSFVTTTTWLQAKAPADPVTYLGVRDACSSPFAVLDIETTAPMASPSARP